MHPVRFVPPQAAIDAAIAAVGRRPGQTLFLGVDGCGASGKTALATRLAAALPGAAVVCCDDFDGPDTAEWDWPRFVEQVAEPLLAGRPARYQDWTWGESRGGGWCDVPVDRPVIVEGVSSTRREVELPWALTVWVEAPRDLRLDRAIARDGEGMLGQWLEHWMPSEDAYVEREHPLARVDLAVSGVIEAVTVGLRGGQWQAQVGERVVGYWDGPGTAAAVAPGYGGHGIEQLLVAERGRLPGRRTGRMERS